MTIAVDEKKIIIIAGPNGAGKTTFAMEFLPNEAGCPVFVNADLISAGLEPFRPESAAVRAGKLMLKEIRAHVLKNESFAFETTLSGKVYSKMIPEWRESGYFVKLIFLSLPSAELAINRVAARVAQGGHNVAENVIKRRFAAGLKNFHEVYKDIVDAWSLFDSAKEFLRLLDQGGL